MSTSPVDFPKELIYYLEAFYEWWGDYPNIPTLHDFLEWLRVQRVKP